MSTQWNDLILTSLSGDVRTPSSQYMQVATAVLTGVETLNHRIPDPTIYGDGVGVATIGIGVNLRVNFRAVMGKFGIAPDNPNLSSADAATENGYFIKIRAIINRSWTASNAAALNGDIDAILSERASESYMTTLYGAAAPPTTINLSVAAGVSLFNKLAPKYAAEVDAFTAYPSNTGAPMPSSLESIALLSLDWNASTLLGRGLNNALADGDRAEAWFEIRYNSNSANDRGLAKRRDFESDVFGLYDNGPVADAEAKQIFEMTTFHSARVFASGTQPDNRVAAANTDYQYALSFINQNASPSTPIVVKTLVNELSPAQLFLQTAYANGKTFLPQNIFVTSDRYERPLQWSVDLSAKTGDQMIFAESLSRKSTLKTNGGSDVLVVDPSTHRTDFTLGSGTDTVDLVDPTHFLGTLGNFSAQDTLDLFGMTDIATATLNPGNTLAVLESNGAKSWYHLDGSTDLSQYKVAKSSDGHGGTNLRIAQSLDNLSLNTNGGAQGFNQTFEGTPGATYDVHFDPSSIPDALKIFDSTTTFIDSGFVSDDNGTAPINTHFTIDSKSDGLVTVNVMGSDPDTTWALSIQKA